MIPLDKVSVERPLRIQKLRKKYSVMITEAVPGVFCLSAF
jgi:hypothetical protein